MYSMIYLVFVAVFVGIVYAINKYYVKQQSAKIGHTMEAAYQRSAVNESELIQSILNNPEWFAGLGSQLHDETVLGLVECLKITTVSDRVASGLIKSLDRSLSRYTGVRFNKNEISHSCYLAITESHLHYLMYENGKCKEHLAFNKAALTNVQLVEAAYKDVLLYEGMASPGSSKKISFCFNSQNYAILFHNFIIRSPFQRFAENKDTNMQLYALTQKFEQKLTSLVNRN